MIKGAASRHSRSPPKIYYVMFFTDLFMGCFYSGRSWWEVVFLTRHFCTLCVWIPFHPTTHGVSLPSQAGYKLSLAISINEFLITRMRQMAETQFSAHLGGNQ